MEPGAVLLVAAAAVAAVAPATADLAMSGRYGLKMEYFGACDTGEFPDWVNISMVWDEEAQQTAYKGYFNRSYDDLADDCAMEVSVYKWGSTGGWNQFYDLSVNKPFDFVTAHVPEIYEYIWEPMGITKKPAPPGIYHWQRFLSKSITLKRFVALPYGRYKLYIRGSKDGKILTCLQMNANVYEVGLEQGS